MRPEDFQCWLSQASELTPSQRRQVNEWLGQERQAVDAVRPILDLEPVCPNYDHTLCARWGNAHGLPRYRCGVCHKTFNVLTGTPLCPSSDRECWPIYAQALIEGATVRKAALRCGIHKNTSFRWRHRFSTLPTQNKPLHLHGIVEADETYFLESHKGERGLARPPHQRGGVGWRPNGACLTSRSRY